MLHRKDGGGLGGSHLSLPGGACILEVARNAGKWATGLGSAAPSLVRPLPPPQHLTPLESEPVGSAGKWVAGLGPAASSLMWPLSLPPCIGLRQWGVQARRQVEFFLSPSPNRKTRT